MKNQDRRPARKADALNVDVMVGRILALWNEAQPWMIEAGIAWYDEARAWAAERADELGIDLEVVAAVLAAYSPRNLWVLNLLDADNLLRGLPWRGGLAANHERALRALQLGLDGLGEGPKVAAFARCILGQPDQVVIDVWAARAALGEAEEIAELGAKGYEQVLGWAGAYDLIADAYRKAAAEVGVEPHHMQAAVWIARRGKAD